MTQVIERLIAADGRASGFEYCLGVLVRVGLHEARTHRPPWPPRRTRLSRVGPSVATMLSVLAWAGTPDPDAAARAFLAGWNRVYPAQGAAYAAPSTTYVPPPDGVHALERTWADLDGLEGAEKAALVDAIGAVVMADRAVLLPEIELTRTICTILHCLVPPIG